jgi:hypothetical protein
MLIVSTSPPSFSLSCNAASRAFLSKGLMMFGIPSRIKVLVLRSNPR